MPALAAFVTDEADRLVAVTPPAGAADARRGLAGPLAVAVVAEALGLGDTDPAGVLDWYAAIVVIRLRLAGRARAAGAAIGSPGRGWRGGGGSRGCGRRRCGPWATPIRVRGTPLRVRGRPLRARLEAQAAVRAVLRLPGLRLDPERPAAPRGLVFRKPPSLYLQWEI